MLHRNCCVSVGERGRRKCLKLHNIIFLHCTWFLSFAYFLYSFLSVKNNNQIHFSPIECNWDIDNDLKKHWAFLCKSVSFSALPSNKMLDDLLLVWEMSESMLLFPTSPRSQSIHLMLCYHNIFYHALLKDMETERQKIENI